MSDLVISVKQISNYPPLTKSSGSETLLLQQGGLGGPYQSIESAAFVATALNAGPSLGVGTTAPAAAGGGNVFAGSSHVLPTDGAIGWNAYFDAVNWRTWTAGAAAAFGWDVPGGFDFTVAGSGTPDQPITWTSVMRLSVAGALNLPFGTLTVARDPAANFEVATLNWVSNNTVASFNNRIGAVTLNPADIYNALQYTSPITTEAWVMGSINQAIGNFAATYPLVNSWNGRTGDVYLMLSDITCVFFQSGQQPVSPTPPQTSNDDSIATTAWVTTWVTNEISGSGGVLASQQWVLANTVNSFNGRLGQVTLTTADVTNAGAAPINSPNFSGIPAAPTANPGTSTAQIATTAFVQSAVAASTAGVSSFNTRTGAVVLTNADITGAGGLANPNVALTGVPTAPTAAPGTNTTQLATTAYVTAAIGGAVTSFNTRTGAVQLLLTDVTGVGGAPIASPIFTGVPAAPTAGPGTSTTQLATTQFVTSAITAAGGVSSFNSRTGAVTLTTNDLSAAGGLTNPSPALTGTPTAPTATVGTNTQQIATTAFVAQALSASAVTSFNTRQGAVTLQGADITAAGGALIASPTFTGIPAAPTAPAATNTTQIATTAFVNAAIAANTATVTSFNTRQGAVVLTTADITGAGGAPITSPAFGGTPTAPTATAGTSTTQLATTQFVTNAIATSGVASFNGRTGAVTLTSNDISAASGALIASPTFTGTPSAPTAAPGTNTTQLATTAYVANYLPLAGGTLSGLLVENAGERHPLASTAGNAAGSIAWNLTSTNDGTGNWTYTAAGVAGLIQTAAAGLNLYTAPSGTAGAAAALTRSLGVTSTTATFSVPLNGSSGTFTGGVGAAQFNSTGRVYWGSTVSTANDTYLDKYGGASTNASVVFSASGGYNITENLSTGHLQFWGNSTNWLDMDFGGNAIAYNGNWSKPGGGPWNATSDDRVKEGIASYTSGLAEILGLRPISFRYNGKGGTVEDEKTYYGLSAQATREIMPELVFDQTADESLPPVIEGIDARTRLTRAQVNGYLPGQLGTDLTALPLALVNAVKEIADRLDAIEARLGAA